ncbi:PREDICTED: NAC transcription factor 29-like [Camelina sativa]|uniref:NAC transcription factor 29-like n=1 Tax=Camelina sativa TaxID=90675 RepID=A0ABM0TU13_CAMSA|nr:PREDICTED: NAC transcription factor 29-like [Camelina sativa]
MSMPGRNKRKERSLPEPEPEPSGIPSSSADDHHSLSSSPSTRPCFPPGVNYRPKDLEVISLLGRKQDYFGGNRELLDTLSIHVVNIYESNPDELSEKFKKANDTEWYFISKRNKMGKDGKRQTRDAKGGYWKATVASKKIDAGQGLVGYKTALSYFVGKRPHGKKTSWLMHEYWIDQCPSADDDVKDYSMCKIYRSPQAINKQKKAEEEENKRQKKVVQQQPPTVEYHQPHALLDSYQPQPHHDIAYQQQHLFQPAPLDSYQQQQQFWPGPLDSYRPHRWQFMAARPDSHQHYDSAYQQFIRMLEGDNGGVQQQQPSFAPPPPPQGHDSRSGMAMSQEDGFFNPINELLNYEEEHGVVTEKQQQEQKDGILPTVH